MNQVQPMQGKGPSPEQIHAHIQNLEVNKEVNLLNSKSLELKVKTTQAKIAEYENEIEILRHNLKEMKGQRDHINLQIEELKKKVRKIQV